MQSDAQESENGNMTIETENNVSNSEREESYAEEDDTLHEGAEHVQYVDQIKPKNEAAPVLTDQPSEEHHRYRSQASARFVSRANKRVSHA